MTEQVEISICVAIYNPNLHELFLTLASAIQQEKISYEIVIADDGSKEDATGRIRDFFTLHHFERYQIIRSAQNKGTVLNYYEAVRNAKGKYIKCISPGDLFYAKDSLYRMIDYMKKNELDACFTDAVFYSDEMNKTLPVVQVLPQEVDVHEKRNLRMQKIYYLVLSDKVCGAAWMIKRIESIRYIELLVNKVKYSEDSLYRIMFLDNKNIGYLRLTTIYYRYGNGVSTNQNSKWIRLLHLDDAETNKILLEKCINKKGFEKRYYKFLKAYDVEKRIRNNMLKILYFPESLPCWLKLKMKRRMNATRASFVFFDECQIIAEKAEEEMA